jgi:zinc transport system ATP-binding protein
VTRPLLKLRDVHVTLGGVEILRGVDLTLERGQVHALIGLNGAGKTTVLRVLVREIPFTGTVQFYCGHDHSKATPEYIGYVPQKLRIEGQLPLTVRDLFGLALQRRPVFLGLGSRTKKRMFELLERVGAAELVDRPMAHLSGGQLQRVLLALALDPTPELLLLDEPAAGIDFRDVEAFYDLIARLNTETGVTILLVSHDLSVVSKLASHIFCLGEGRIVCAGPPTELLHNEALRKTFGEGSALYVHSHSHGEQRP